MGIKVNCDDLPGHLAAICRGTHRKANGQYHSIQDRQKIIGRSLRIEPSDVELPLPHQIVKESKYYSGIGTRLHAIIAREAGSETPCGECKEAISRLNIESPESVLARIDELASDIVTRATTKAKKWWQRWGARLAPETAKGVVRKWIYEACQIPAKVNTERRQVGEIVTAIRTAKRDQPTLAITLDSMRSAGFVRPIIFGEPDVPGVVDVRWNQHRKSFRGFLDHAKWLLENTDGMWFLLCEDDVLFAPGLAERLSAMEVSGEIVTLFKPHAVRAAGAGMREVDHVNGSLAVLICRRVLRMILGSTTAMTWDKKDCVDKFISRSAAELRVPILTPATSWVQHIGETSVCQPERWKSNSLTHRARFAWDFEPPSLLPGVTLITPTGDRPESFALCEKWMSRQTFNGPLTWIVIDDGVIPTKCTRGQQYIRRKPSDGEGHTLARNLWQALPHIDRENVLIIEDDEWYSPQYVEQMTEWLKADSLVGSGIARYYWPRDGAYRDFPDHKHASLCRSGFRTAELLTTFAECCQSDDPSVDLRLWGAENGKRHDTARPLVVGMKGMPGRKSGGGRSSAGTRDRDLSVLRSWIGDDIDRYLPILPKHVDATRAKREQIVVYTVVLGGYDRILPPTMINPNVRYVAITDGTAPAPWEIVRPSGTEGLSRQHASRKLKILGPGLFPAADWTIYVDGQLQLATDPVRLLAECEAWGTSDLYLFRHHDRDCIFDEAAGVVKVGKERQSVVQPQIDRYRDSGVQPHSGLYLGGILIRRGRGACYAFSEAWWREVATGSYRDQIGLPVALQASEQGFTALPANWWHHFFHRHHHIRSRIAPRT